MVIIVLLYFGLPAAGIFMLRGAGALEAGE